MRLFFTRPDSPITAAPVPLGMMSLAAYLRQHRHGDEYRFYDARVRLTPNEQLVPLIAEYRPDLVCITAFSLEADLAHDLARRVKQALPGCRVFLGGPYATSDPLVAIQDENIDMVFIGEGETTLLAVLNALEAGQPLDGIKGIAFRRDGQPVSNGYPDMIDDLDALPPPAWDLLDFEPYFSRRGKRPMMNKLQRSPRGVSLFTTRGCPYRCSYCHNVFGKKLRKRSVENVIAELKLLHDTYGVRELEFLDDIFNLDMERAAAIFDGMARENLHFHITFPNGLRAEYLTDELLRKFKDGGVYWITVAIESGSPRIQKAIHKNVDLIKAQANIDRISRLGINCNGFFMMGFLDETEEEIRQTINFAVQSRLVIASFFILTPFPNTEIYNEAVAAGHDMTARYSDYHDVAVNLSKVPTKRLWQLKKMAYRKFYLSPKRIYLIIRANPFRVGLLEGIFYLFKMVFTGRELKKSSGSSETSPVTGTAA
ncbi:MAG: radical SAM protein [Candidatus Zixiibacteriota bacterium]|nr:MAG: radical SAM protein [candidate division Zixibacteria bacterium]